MYREKPQSSISVHHFSDVASFSKISQPTPSLESTNQQRINSVIYHPCPSGLASGIHPYFFKLLRVLSLSKTFVEFSVTCVFQHSKFFQFMVFTLENTLNLCIFTHAPVPQSKICFPQGPRTKRWRKLWFTLLKFNQKKWRWLGTLVYLYFVWFTIFLNVMALLFCE